MVDLASNLAAQAVAAGDSGATALVFGQDGDANDRTYFIANGNQHSAGADESDGYGARYPIGAAQTLTLLTWVFGTDDAIGGELHVQVNDGTAQITTLASATGTASLSPPIALARGDYVTVKAVNPVGQLRGLVVLSGTVTPSSDEDVPPWFTPAARAQFIASPIAAGGTVSTVTALAATPLPGKWTALPIRVEAFTRFNNNSAGSSFSLGALLFDDAGVFQGIGGNLNALQIGTVQLDSVLVPDDGGAVTVVLSNVDTDPALYDGWAYCVAAVGPAVEYPQLP